MAAAVFEKAFDRSLPISHNKTLTVTPAPERESELLGLLEGAMMRARHNHTQLTQIQLPFERFPSMDSKFWHIPVEDSGDAQVLRFFSTRPTTKTADVRLPSSDQPLSSHSAVLGGVLIFY